MDIILYLPNNGIGKVEGKVQSVLTNFVWQIYFNTHKSDYQHSRYRELYQLNQMNKNTRNIII